MVTNVMSRDPFALGVGVGIWKNDFLAQKSIPKIPAYF